MSLRLQLTAFLPQPLMATVNERRRRWDPSMADRIDAHITIVHDTSQVESFDERLESVSNATAPFTVRLTSAARWTDPEQAIYVGVEDADGAIAAFRQALRVTDPPGLAYAPHVTLVHPRTSSSEQAERAWRSLENWSINQTVRLDELVVIEFDGSRWQNTNTVKLSGGS